MDSHSTTLTTEEKRVTTRWAIRHAIYEDCYNIICVQYVEYLNEQTNICYYLDQDGNWIEFPEGTEIQPCVKLSGKLVHAATQTDSRIDFTKIEDQLFEKWLHWVQQLANAPGLDNDD